MLIFKYKIVCGWLIVTFIWANIGMSLLYLEKRFKFINNC